MVVNHFGQPHQNAYPGIAVTDHLVQRARVIIESMMPGQAANMDAVLLAGVTLALARQESEQRALHH